MDAADNRTGQVLEPELALWPICIGWVFAATASRTGRLWVLLTACSNCCMMVSFWEWLGNKLAGRWHHGQVSAASWFPVDMIERPFVMGSDSTLTTGIFRVCFSCLSILKLILFQSRRHTNMAWSKLYCVRKWTNPRLSLAVSTFRTASELVCANLATRCSGTWSSSEWLQLCTRAQQQYELWTFESFSDYTEDHVKPPELGVGACAGMGACPGQYGTARVVSLQQVVCGVQMKL